MTHALPFASGVAAALLSVGLTRPLGYKHAAEFFNLAMAATAAFYFGSALPAHDTGTLLLEAAIGAPLFLLTFAGQWWSLKFTAIAFLLHGTWDLAHVTLGMGAEAGVVFPVFCVAYDWVLAGYLWWMSGATDKQRKTATG
jgi:hypothetical protein